MTGQELIDFIKANKAEDAPVMLSDTLDSPTEYVAEITKQDIAYWRGRILILDMLYD